MAYTTGVKYMINDKPIIINLPTSLYNKPIGVNTSPIVNPDHYTHPKLPQIHRS